MDSLTKAISIVESWLDYEHESGRLDDETVSAIDEVLAAAIYMDRGEIVNPKEKSKFICELHDQNDHYHCETCGCPVFDHENSEHVCPEGFRDKRMIAEHSDPQQLLMGLAHYLPAEAYVELRDELAGLVEQYETD